MLRLSPLLSTTARTTTPSLHNKEVIRNDDIDTQTQLSPSLQKLLQTIQTPLQWDMQSTHLIASLMICLPEWPQQRALCILNRDGDKIFQAMPPQNKETLASIKLFQAEENFIAVTDDDNYAIPIKANGDSFYNALLTSLKEKIHPSACAWIATAATANHLRTDLANYIYTHSYQVEQLSHRIAQATQESICTYCPSTRKTRRTSSFDRTDTPSTYTHLSASVIAKIYGSITRASSTQFNINSPLSIPLMSNIPFFSQNPVNTVFTQTSPPALPTNDLCSREIAVPPQSSMIAGTTYDQPRNISNPFDDASTTATKEHCYQGGITPPLQSTDINLSEPFDSQYLIPWISLSPFSKNNAESLIGHNSIQTLSEFMPLMTHRDNPSPLSNKFNLNEVNMQAVFLYDSISRQHSPNTPNSRLSTPSIHLDESSHHLVDDFFFNSGHDMYASFELDPFSLTHNAIV